MFLLIILGLNIFMLELCMTPTLMWDTFFADKWMQNLFISKKQLTI